MLSRGKAAPCTDSEAKLILKSGIFGYHQPKKEPFKGPPNISFKRNLYFITKIIYEIKMPSNSVSNEYNMTIINEIAANMKT